MKKKIYELKNSLSTKKSKQVISLYWVNITGIPLGLVTSMILTRYLGPKLFGDYSYLNVQFLFAYHFFYVNF
ncbi:hypothetical protein [Flavobacterium undicola]|uniref:hypothetical protein n=1 Tax=Flavobacterium undicola TaxID=1932779 RepID=UPI0015E210B1|nr:hypothetical protein [Flavobacterium undicola]MBA0882467.1 hypothetical protein [Flavobacterium undicola]